jgi:hypothetical protein
MTKEEVLNKSINEEHDSWTTSYGMDFFDGYGSSVLKAMEAYAQQERISILKYAQYQSTRNPEQLNKMYLESKEK